MALTVEEARDLRLAGETHVRYSVRRRHSPLPGRVPIDDHFPHLQKETAVYSSVDWMIIDQHLFTADGKPLVMQSFSTEDAANERVDELNAKEG